MRKFEKFVQQLQKRLNREFADVEYFPRKDMIPAYVRAKLQSKMQLEPVFEIKRGADKEMFISSFYILNCKIAGHYGITADDPCAIHYGKYGSFEDILPHIQKALAWLDELQSNDFEIPEERKYDAVDDLFSRLDPKLLARGWMRAYTHSGNWQQLVVFSGNDQYEGSLEVSFYNKNWHFFFELLSRSPEIPRKEEFTWESIYSRSCNADAIAQRINKTLEMLYNP